MMKTGKNKRLLASILAASMMLTMSPFAFAAADTAEQKEMTTQEQVQSAAQNETNANPTVSQTEDQSPKDTNSEAPKTESQSPKDTNSEASKTEGQSPKDTNSEGGQPSKDVKPAGGNTTAGDSTSASKTPAEPEKPTESETPTEPEAPKNAAKIGDTEYPTVANAIDAAQSGGTIELLRNVTENITINKSLTLDLGGFTLSGDGTTTVVSISGKDIDVTVKDGTVTGGKSTNGGGLDIQSGEILLEKCNITKNNAVNGGAINISGSANVQIKGSEIHDNTASNSGGAIYMASGWAIDGYYNCACEIVDTKLNNNSANVGGALGMGASMYQYKDMHITASFTMSGKSEISSNTAKTLTTTNGGGGVYLIGNGSRFIMNDGFITDNVAENSCGGAIFSKNWRGITLNGGSITGNSAKIHGGAIYIENVNLTNNPLEEEVLNVAAGVAITDNHCGGNGGGIAALKDVTVKLAKNSALYNNTAETIGDDVYSGSGNQLNLPAATEMSGGLILSSDSFPITDWYYDGFKDANTRHRWGEKYSELDIDATVANGALTYKTGIYYEIFKPVENFKGTIALKAAHAQLFTLTYNVTGDLPEGYTAPTAQSMLVGSSYTVADVPASVSGSKDGVNGTFSFNGWKKDDGTVLTGEQQLTADLTLHGVWTFTKKSSGGGGGGSHKPTVTIPDDVPTGLNGDDHYAYIVGYPDSTVRPQNGITRAEVATIFFRLLTDETRNANSTKTNSYSDVAAGAWYNHAVSTLSAMGIVRGDSHGKFNPNAPITRAEFAAIAARFDDKANTTAVDFSDIASHWAKNEISAAANNGWINGYTDGTFRPNNKITRAEAMTLVNRVLKRLPETAEDLHNDMIKWSDNSDTSAWYYLAVQEATNSHYYDIKENKHEKWSKLRETRDWTELEK